MALAIDLCATHKTHPIEYCAWRGMRKRCRNPNNADWARYGGRGISICERWDSFANFFADMGLKPSPKHSLDRINPNGNYEPENCRWATAMEQANNRADKNKKFTLDGITLTQSEWARRIGITRHSLRDRLNNGWTIERALKTPPIRSRNKNNK